MSLRHQRLPFGQQRGEDQSAERHGAVHRRRGHARQRAGTLHQLLDETRPRSAVRIRARRQRDACDQRMAGIETERDVLHLPEAFEQQTGIDQQHHGERHLARHQEAASPMPAAPGGAPAPVAQDSVQVGAGDAQRRDEPERDARRRRDRDRKGEHREIQPDRLVARQIVAGIGLDQPFHAPVCQHRAEHRACRGQQEALGEQLPHQLPSTGADGRAHRDLLRARRRPRQYQACHVGARNQQHQRDRSRQDRQRRANAAGEALLHRNQRQVRVGVGVGRARMLPTVLRDQHRGFRVGPRQGDAGAEARHRYQVARAARDLFRLKPAVAHQARHPDIDRAIRVGILRRHHPDDGVDIAIERQGLARDFAIAAETPLPQPVADQRDRRAAAFPFRRAEASTQQRARSEHLQKVRRHAYRRHPLRLCSAGEREGVETDGRDTGEGAVAVAQRLIRGQGKRAAGEAQRRIVSGNRNQPLRFRQRKRAQDQRVHHREYGRVRADAEGQRGQRHNREAGAAPHHADGEA